MSNRAIANSNVTTIGLLYWREIGLNGIRNIQISLKFGKGIMVTSTSNDPFTPVEPNEMQQERLKALREGAKIFAGVLDRLLPTGPDKTHVFRTFRTAMMWANVAVMRQPDGTPRAGKDDQAGGQETA